MACKIGLKAAGSAWLGPAGTGQRAGTPSRSPVPAPSGPHPSIAFHEPPLGTEAHHPPGTLSLPSTSEGFNIVVFQRRGVDSFLLSNKVIRKDGHSSAALVTMGQDALSLPPTTFSPCGPWWLLYLPPNFLCLFRAQLGDCSYDEILSRWL